MRRSRPRPSGCWTMRRRWCAARRCGRSPGSIRARLAARAAGARSRNRARRARGMGERASQARPPECRRCSASASAIARASTSPNSDRASSASSGRRGRRSPRAGSRCWHSTPPRHRTRCARAVAAATHLLLSATPERNRRSDLQLRSENAIASAPKLASIVYLSSLGVYGDHGGAWVDETATTIPAHARGGARLARRAGLAGARAEARRSGRGAAARRHLWARAERVHAAPRRARAPRRQAGARIQPHPCRPISRRRSTPPSRAKPTASSTSPTTSPRAYSDQVLLAAKLLGVDPPKELSMEEARESPDADGAQLLRWLRAGEERQAQDARSA